MMRYLHFALYAMKVQHQSYVGILIYSFQLCTEGPASKQINFMPFWFTPLVF